MASNSYSNIYQPQMNLSPLPGSSPFAKATPFSTALGNVSSGQKTPAPSTALKSSTYNNVDGSSVTHSYHTPDFSSSTRINSQGQVETPNAALGGAFVPSGGNGLLNDQMMAVRTGQAPVSSLNQNQQTQTNSSASTQNNSQNNNQGGISLDQIKANLAAYNATNPSSNNQNTDQNQKSQQTNGIDNSQFGTGLQGGLIQNALNAQNVSRNFSASYNQGMNDITKKPIALDFQQGQQAALQRDYGVQDQALATEAQNATTLAGLASPISQFGVLTNPQTGQPISGGNIGSLAFQGGTIAGQQSLGTQVAGMTAANVAAKGIQNSITSYLQQNPQLNPSDATFANAISQWVSGQQLGDPKYQTLANYLNEYISTLAPILGVGGDTTNLKTQIAQSFVNARASGQSIAQVLSNISTLADQKVQNLSSGAQGGGVVSGGSSNGSSNGGWASLGD